MNKYAARKVKEQQELEAKWRDKIAAERKASPPKDREWLAIDPEKDENGESYHTVSVKDRDVEENETETGVSDLWDIYGDD